MKFGMTTAGNLTECRETELERRRKGQRKAHKSLETPISSDFPHQRSVTSGKRQESRRHARLHCVPPTG